MAKDTLTITDNRTGKSYEIPVKDGTIRTMDLRQIKANALTSHVPILFLTGHAADETTAVAALAAGGNDFLQKPYLPSLLLARVNCQIAIHDAHARLRQMVMTDELTGVTHNRGCRPMRHIAVRHRHGVAQHRRKIAEARAEHDRGARQRPAAAADHRRARSMR